MGLPDAEDRFWHEHYLFEPYFVAGRGYDQYQPAYALGWQAAQRPSAQPGAFVSAEACQQEFAARESELCACWNREHASSFLTWSQARLAVKAAWDRVRLPRKLVPAVWLSAEVVQRMQLALRAGQRVQQRYEACLSAQPEGMLRSVLERFAREHPALLRELEQTFLPLSPGPGLGRKDIRFHVGSRYKQVEKMMAAWRNRRLAEQLPVEALLDELQAWLDNYARIDTDALPLPAAQVVRRQVLLVRGRRDAVLLLARGKGLPPQMSRVTTTGA
ncbi:hypothetical protein GCM10010975_28550 [Comamonas phosphati]|nr:hypothetical protein GCM10010975_28550 [Comamonas phosphati]